MNSRYSFGQPVLPTDTAKTPTWLPYLVVAAVLVLLLVPGKVLR